MSNPAETYEREMVPALFAPWAAQLVEQAEPRAGERVLDVACGTGVVAREAARRVGARGEIVGLDINPAMLAVAREAAQHAGAVVEWRQGPAEAIPFPDGHFDLVLCQQGLQFVPEKPRAAGEMHRVLRDGGRVALSVWRDLDHHPFFRAMNDVIVRHLGIPALAAPFSYGDAAELRNLLAGAGFGDIVVETRSMDARFRNPEQFIAMEVDVIAAAIPSAQHMDTRARAALVKAIETDGADPMRDVTQGDCVVIPMHAHVASARRTQL